MVNILAGVFHRGYRGRVFSRRIMRSAGFSPWAVPVGAGRLGRRAWSESGGPAGGYLSLFFKKQKNRAGLKMVTSVFLKLYVL